MSLSNPADLALLLDVEHNTALEQIDGFWEKLLVVAVMVSEKFLWSGIFRCSNKLLVIEKSLHQGRIVELYRKIKIST